jgi:hypothetical protein
MKSTKGLVVALGCVAAGLAQFSAAQAATIIYTSESEFEAVAAPTALETFDGGVSSLLTVVSGSDIFMADALQDMVWRNDDVGTVFTFAYDVTAFGGVFDLSRGGFGHGIRFSLLREGGEEEVDTLLARRDGFFGFTSTEAFSAVRVVWSGSKHNGRETYALDDVRITAAPLARALSPSASAAPEPSTWAVMLAGFAGAGASLRRRNGGRAAA